MLVNESPPLRMLLERIARIELNADGRVGSHAAADAAIDSWGALLLQLGPLIGDNGVRALCGRCLHLGATTYPWLAGLPKPPAAAPALVDLRAALRSRPADEAAATCVALLTAFTGLLATLIGQALTDRLLVSAWPDAAFDPFPAKASDD